MHTAARTVTLSVLLAGLAAGFLVGAGCAPAYPSCETDTQCNKGEFCVARKCQKCRDTRDCKEGFACTGGKCSAVAGFCKDRSQCPSGQECIANRCSPCDGDAQCPSGLKCTRGQCAKPQCVKDDDCAQDQDCMNGACVGSTKKVSDAPPCQLEAVYFGFDQSALAGDSTAALNRNADCLKKTTRAANLIGRADPRGTTEYNLALSDRRSQAVKEYLQRLGIDSGRLRPVPRGALDASGTDEGSWAKDRRVDGEWQ